MSYDGWILEASPFHDGERALQARVGARDDMERFGRRVIRPYMPRQHRDFYEQLPFIVVGSVDPGGRPWASLLFGQPGFVSSADETSLSINLDTNPHDPVAPGLVTGSAIGLLGIELPTRRRNRVNGRITNRTGHTLSVQVDQSFGNCPQYIQSRDHEWVSDHSMTAAPAEHAEGLDARDRALISRSDTFFVASFHFDRDEEAASGVDVSHRGGRPGFVDVAGNTLTIPDFTGNNHFNTLGNFLVNPLAGLVFLDFETGDMLFLSGRVELIWDVDERLAQFDGAERAWRFIAEKRIRIEGLSPLRFSKPSASPNTVLTGSWVEADSRLRADRQRETWREFDVIRVDEESETVRSFHLLPRDGVLPTFQAGQYLPIRVPAGPNGETVIRTYTLSSAPSDPCYRISVKREDEGQVSSWLHEHMQPGAILEAKAPRGSFIMDPNSRRPLLFLAGGVGITPVMAMTRQEIIEGFRLRRSRRMTVIHAVRDSRERAFGNTFRNFEAGSEGAFRYVPVSSGHTTENEISGRITAALLQRALPIADYDVYLCGPPAFMQAMYDLLLELGIADRRIHAESFGQSALDRRLSAETAPVPSSIATEALVRFTGSDLEHRWTPEEGSLLDLAEAHGLQPEFSCRTGRCGTCAVPLISGKVVYPTQPDAAPADENVLICSARPAAGCDRVELDL